MAVPGPSRRALVGLAIVFVTLSLLSTLSSEPGRYVADARFEHVTAPGQFLEREAYLWDDARSLGKPAPYFSPATSAFQATVAATGAQPWLIERLTHALYLSLAALGVVLLMCAFRPRVGVAHVVAAFVYAFCPYSARFLLPSGLFLAYALAPWFAWFALRGVRGADPWRWAAAFALAIAAFGTLNVAAVGFALIPAALIAVYFTVQVRRGFRRLWSWAWRCALLSVLTCSAAIVVMWFSAPDISVNLRTTELPQTVARTSAWFESWRGLGMWVDYFGNGSRTSEATPYFTSPAVILASFVPPLAALMVLALGRWRYRLLFGSMLLIALVLMVGIHGGGTYLDQSPSPFGQLLSFAFDHWTFARGFRATYKAGAGLMLGIAILLGIGVAAVVRRARRGQAGDPAVGLVQLRRRRLVAGLGLAVILAGVVVASFPFWTGGVYNSDASFGSIPKYWTRAFDYLRAQRQPGRVLVLPGPSRAGYRWGFVNDNLFDGLSPMSPLIDQTLPQGTPESADLIRAINQYVDSPTYIRGTLAPMLERLGVGWVLIQNDLNWRRSILPRPSAYNALRHDPGLRLAAKFGRPGLNTTSSRDPDAAPFGERSLPPVEIYKVVGNPSPRPRLTAGPPVLVAGAGDSWPALAAAGLLKDAPIAYTGAASDDVLRQMIESGSPVVVTDGNRRRVTQATTGVPVLSTTLAAGESYDRPADDLFGNIETQSLAAYHDARSISASTAPPGGAFPRSPSTSGASAFDGVASTGWNVGGQGDLTGAWLTVHLRRPQTVSGISILPRAAQSRQIKAVDVIMRSRGGDRTRRRIRFDGPPSRRARQRMHVADVSSITLRIARVSRGVGTVGIAEVGVITPHGPLNLREFVRTPNDLAARAASDKRLAAALAARPPRYELRRFVGPGGQDAETDLRREIYAFGNHAYHLAITARVDNSTPDSAIETLLDSPVRAVGSSRFLDQLDNRGDLAVDDNLSTGWVPNPRVGERLHLQLPETNVRNVEVMVVSGQTRAGPRSRVTSVRVSVGAPGQRQTAASTLPPREHCASPRSPGGGCLETHTVQIQPTEARRLTVTLTGLRTVRGRFGAAPPSVVEVQVNGTGWSGLANSTARPTCAPLFAIDGERLGVRLPSHPLDVLAGKPLDLRGCNPVRLHPGDHHIDSMRGLSGAVLTASLVPHGWNDVRHASQPQSPRGRVKLVDHSPTQWQLRLNAPKGALLIGGMPWHGGWVADTGQLARYPVPLDTFAAWTVKSQVNGPVALEFQPQRTYELAMAMSIAAVAWCLWRVTRHRQRRPR
jgi:arabinofuranan 3-O-arabinosyltransferase